MHEDNGLAQLHNRCSLGGRSSDEYTSACYGLDGYACRRALLLFRIHGKHVQRAAEAYLCNRGGRSTVVSHSGYPEYGRYLTLFGQRAGTAPRRGTTTCAALTLDPQHVL